MTMNSTRKGFAYHLGHGLGSAVAGVLSLEHRILTSANARGTVGRRLIKLAVLAVKLGIVVALGALLLFVFSWVVSSLLMIAAVVVVVRLLGAPHRVYVVNSHELNNWSSYGWREDGPDGPGYYSGNCRVE